MNIKRIIKEVPVETIVEKEVIKEVYKTDDEVVNKLQEELDELGIVLKDTIEGFDDERKANSKIQNEKDVENETLSRKVTELTDKITQLQQELEIKKT